MKQQFVGELPQPQLPHFPFPLPRYALYPTGKTAVCVGHFGIASAIAVAISRRQRSRRHYINYKRLQRREREGVGERETVVLSH